MHTNRGGAGPRRSTGGGVHPPATPTAALIHTLSISRTRRPLNAACPDEEHSARSPGWPRPPRANQDHPPGPADPAAFPHSVPRSRGRLVPGLGRARGPHPLRRCSVPRARPALLPGPPHWQVTLLWRPRVTAMRSGARLRGRAVAPRGCGRIRRPPGDGQVSFPRQRGVGPATRTGPSCRRPAAARASCQGPGGLAERHRLAGRRRRPWTQQGGQARLGHGQAGGQHGTRG